MIVTVKQFKITRIQNITKSLVERQYIMSFISWVITLTVSPMVPAPESAARMANVRLICCEIPDS